MRRLFIFLSLFFVSPAILAESYYPPLGPIPVRNQNPLYLQFLDLHPQRTEVLPAGTYQVEMQAAYSNLFERNASPATGYQVALDMELLRHSIFFRYGVMDRFELGVELPLLHFNGGFLDSFIQDFHHFFGLPNAGRELYPNGTFEYAIRKNGVPLYEVNPETYGLSDIILDFKHQIFKEAGWHPGLASIFYLKLPTGDRGHGLGSGNPDFGFQVAAEKNYDRYHGTLNLSYTVLGGNDLLAEISRPAVLGWMTGLEISLIRELWSLMLQMSGDTGLFHGTGLTELDEGALNLTVGFGGRVGDFNEWKVAFEEDPDSDGAAVDFTVFFQWGTRWGGPKKIRGLMLGRLN
ncbi:MAG: DUF3187 family protein [Deltaproteobacteria bacterium]|nr:DUF3187 family protein [Deltaproteobacteria bacterium]